MSKFSKKEIKQKIDNSYQEIISCNEETFQEDNQKILQLTIKGTMKKEHSNNNYQPKNQFEALVINQLMSINNRLDGLEIRMDNLEISINQMKNTPTMKKELKLVN